MDKNNNGIIVVLILLVLVILGVIGVQKYRDIKYTLLDNKKEVVNPNNAASNYDYKLISVDNVDYIVNKTTDGYSYIYSDSDINYLGTSGDNMYFSDTKGTFSINYKNEYIRNDVNTVYVTEGFIDGENIYYLNSNNLYSLNINDGSVSLVDNTSMSSMYYYNGLAYYLDNNGRLYSLDIEKNKTVSLDTNVVDFDYSDSMVLLLHSDGKLSLYDIGNNKFSEIDEVSYNTLYTNAYVYNGSVYYLNSSNTIVKNSNGTVENYYTNDDMAGFEIVDNKNIKVYYIDGSIHYVSDKVLVESNPLESYEFVNSDGVTIKFDSSNIEK